LIAASAFDRGIQSTNMFNAKLCQPIAILKKRAEKLGIFWHGQKFVRLMATRIT
jgi:hypothetical protein